MIPIKPVAPVVGNKECRQLLEGLLERVELGEVNSVAVAFAESPTVGFNDYAGTNESSFAIIANLLALQNRLLAPVLPNAPHAKAPVQSDIPANLVAYDINNEPLQFDFLPWLVTAEMTRIREGAPAPLKVAFFRGPTNIEFNQPELISQQYWREKVLIPMIRMIGAELSDEAIKGRRPSCYSFVEVVEAFKAGEQVPWLFPSAGAVNQVYDAIKDLPSNLITITLRESDHYPHRNSNPDEWLRFARKLRDEGEFVLFVRDSAKAGETFHEFPVFPLASRDLEARVALYDRAKCNFFVDNGPFTLALLGNAPWLAFVNANPMTGYIPNTPQWWKRNHGVAVGEQFPWSSPEQRIVWKPDTFENMCAAWEEFAPKLAKAA